jgi:hypothetical protein
MAILLVGSDMEGKMFSEETNTVLLSRHGAGIVSHYKLSPEQELILRRLDSNKEAEIRIVGQIGVEEDVYTYGVAFLDSTENFWGIKFPPASEAEQEARFAHLECSSCRTRETVEQSDLESDVYLVNEGIVRYCKQCGSSTFWKRALEDVEEAPMLVEVGLRPSSAAIAVEEEPEPASAPAPAPEAKPAAKENRRKHVRTKANFKACIRSFGFGDDVVGCEDISRGGLCFKSRKRYTEKMKIEVAAPYTAGVQNFFVPGEVVYVQELQDEKVFRCGVEYLGRSRG